MVRLSEEVPISPFPSIITSLDIIPFLTLGKPLKTGWYFLYQVYETGHLYKLTMPQYYDSEENQFRRYDEPFLRVFTHHCPEKYYNEMMGKAEEKAKEIYVNL